MRITSATLEDATKPDQAFECLVRIEMPYTSFEPPYMRLEIVESAPDIKVRYVFKDRKMDLTLQSNGVLQGPGLSFRQTSTR